MSPHNKQTCFNHPSRDFL